MVRAGEVSPRELVELYLERIERLEPELNAFGWCARSGRGPRPTRPRSARPPATRRRCYGVPIAVKDSHDVAGELTTHGTGCVDEPAAEDSEMVRRLRAAGAIVIGKTNLPELAFAMFTEIADLGRDPQPWDTDADPRRLVRRQRRRGRGRPARPPRTASDGAGSIRYPAAYCALFGLKPQRGRVPLDPDRRALARAVRQRLPDPHACSTRRSPRRHGRRRPGAPTSRRRPSAPSPRRRRTPPGKLRIAVSAQGHPGAGAPDAGRALPRGRRGDGRAARLAGPPR